MACSLVAVVPFILHGPSCGHDFDFHLLSWLETAHDWHHHLLAPRWLATANYGAGEPRFIFYPPLSWTLGALLGSTVGVVLGQSAGWTFAPILFTFFSIFAAGVCVYLLALTLASRLAALTAACLFVANPYLLFVAYERTAYAELLATPFIALLLLFSLRKVLPVTAMAVVIAGLWLTNAPAAVMGCYALAFVSLLRLLKERDWPNALRAAASCGLGLALAGFYLVPAAWEQRWVQISRAIDHGMRVQDSFLFRYAGQVYHDQVLRTASILTVILVSIGVIASGVIIARKRGKLEAPALIFASLLGCLFLLQFPVSMPLWRALPRLQFLQFPWRWLLVVSILSACLVAMALTRRTASLSKSNPRHAKLFLIPVVTLVCVSVWLCSRSFYLACDDQDTIAGQLATFHDGAGVEGTDEYTSVGADNSAIFQDTPQVRLLTIPDAEEPASDAGDNPEWPGYSLGAIDAAPGTITIARWEPESRQVSVVTKEPAFAVLTLMDYPAWQVTVNGRDINNRPKREDGLMTVPIEAGKSVIAVDWSTTPDIWWGRSLSAAALVIIIAMLSWKRKQRDS
jgi:hypothetical protein